jgi:hypothetical protein
MMVVLAAVVFHPDFQKKMLLDHVGPLVDTLEVEHVHLTPWSLDVDNLAVEYAGGRFQLGRGTFRYCLSSLLLLNINVKTLALQDLKLDLEAFNPPATELPETEATETGPFPGVLASLEHGLSYTLQDLMVDATVRLPDQQSLTATITGGGIKPGAKGAINAAIRFNTGNEDDHFDLDGELILRQLTRGRFESIEPELAIQATLATLPEPEHVNVSMHIKPAPISEDAQATPASTENAVETQFTPEDLRVVLLLNDSNGNTRSTLELEGIYNGNNGDFDGNYGVAATEKLVQPYLGDKVIPPAEEQLTGELAFNIATLTGVITVTSDLQMTEIREVGANDKLPEMLQLKNNFRLSLLPGNELRVETLDTGLSDEAAHRPLATKLPADLNIPLDDIDTFLHQEHTLLEFELPEVPLAWFDVFLPDQEITAGSLTAAFRITNDTDSAIHIRPLKRLEISGLTIQQQDAVLIEGLNVSLLPGVSYAGNTLSVSLDELVVDAGKGTLASANLNAIIPLSGENQDSIDAQATANLELHRLLEFLAIEQTGRQKVPRRLALDSRVTLQQQPGLVSVNTLDVNLALENNTRLLQLQLLQPLVMETTETGSHFRNTEGKVARLDLSDIRLEWFSPFVPDTMLRGTLGQAGFSLSTDAEGAATLVSDKRFAINNVYVAGPDGPLLEDLDISLRPVIHHSPASTQITYKDFRIDGKGARLVSANGKITLPAAADIPVVAEGRLDVDVQRLSQQPLIAAALQAEVEAPVRLEADYSLAQGNSSIDISRLAVNLFYADPQPRVSLQANSKLRVRTMLGRKDSQLTRTTGKATLTVANLTPEPFASILAANGIAFTEANGKAVLTSKGKSLTVDTVEPFVVAGIDVHNEDGAVLQPFTLLADSEMTIKGNTLEASLEPLSITFDRQPETQALEVNLNLTLQGAGDDVRLDNLNAALTVLLPVMLDQPAILPDHTLTGGELRSRVKLNQNGKLASTTRIHGLQAKEELALQMLQLNVDGQLDRNGGFTLAAPLATTGKSGNSDLQMNVTHSPGDEGTKNLDISIDSTVFYFNDILNTLNTIAGKQAVEESAEEAEEGADSQAAQSRPKLSLQPDDRAFWDVTDYDAHIKLDLKHLFYTDYLEIHDIKGSADYTPDRLALNDFSAHFHESPITADGSMEFSAGEMPYTLQLKTGVERIDLARLFRELVPGSKPRAEGLFDGRLEAFGQSPNLAQYRNNLFIDMRLHSQDGVFRPFDPDSALLAGSSGVAGAVGEVVSYVPTGLFGLGAVSRLVYYIKEFEYDKIDLHIVRDESRDLQIREYVIQSPEVLMTADGSIEYQEGVDILYSPLSMVMQLDMRGRGAAILHSLGLRQDEQDAYGYWKGPEIKAWGMLAKTESNLEDIINDAGRGAVLGGITRPISGLRGNIKHLWFGDGEAPVEYTTEQ